MAPRVRNVFLGLVIFFAVFPTFSFAATTQTTLSSNKVSGPTNGLVGYWTFNGPDINWNTNTVLDRSGQGNTGTFMNMATKTSPVAGRLGQALKFLPSPTVDYVNSGSAALLDNMSTFTASAWVNMTQKSGIVTLTQKAPASTPLTLSGWRIEVRLGTQDILLSVGCSGASLYAYSLPSSLKNGWHLITVTYNGGLPRSSVNFYVDGVDIGRSAGQGNDGTGSRGNDGSWDLTIGGYETQSNYHLNGILDDVRIYNRILTPQEITQLYNVGQVKIATPVKKNASGLVGWWTFDGPDVNWTTNTALDKSGNGNTGTLYNMATKTSPVAGKLGQALRFDDVNDYIRTASAILSPSDPSQPYTISQWIKTSVGDYNTFLSQYFCCGAGRFIMTVRADGRVTYNKNWTDIAVSAQSVKDNKWHHVLAVKAGSDAGQVQLYVDGVASGASGTDNNIFLNTPVEIGRDTQADHYFNGLIDDVRIYNRALSSTEITQLYKSGQVTVNYFVCGVSTVKDADNNVYNTVKIGTQCWMKQNMRVGTMVTAATNQTNNATVEKWCYSNTLANCMTNNNPNQPDGGLYQWNEAMQYSTTPGARGICPVGWHIPTHDQFTTLERAVCTSGSCVTDFPYDTTTTSWRGTTEGTKLKANGTSGWESNLAGFIAISSFFSRVSEGYIWSSSESGANAWARNLSNLGAQVYRYADGKANGFSVRCIKD